MDGHDPIVITPGYQVVPEDGSEVYMPDAAIVENKKLVVKEGTTEVTETIEPQAPT